VSKGGITTDCTAEEKYVGLEIDQVRQLKQLRKKGKLRSCAELVWTRPC